MCTNNIKLIYLTFIHSTYKFEKHKQSVPSANYEQIFPNKKHKQREKGKSVPLQARGAQRVPGS